MGWRRGLGVKALLQLANFTLGPDATLNTEIHKIRFAERLPTQSMHIKAKTKIKLLVPIHIVAQVFSD